jgi:hypothetical protein
MSELRFCVWFRSGHTNIHPSIHSFIHPFTGAYNPGRTFGLPFRGFLITHIQTHGRTPLHKWSAHRRGLYLHRTTQHIDTTNYHAPSGIRTRDPSNQATADLRLTPRGHWDRRSHQHIPHYLARCWVHQCTFSVITCTVHRPRANPS